MNKLITLLLLVFMIGTAPVYAAVNNDKADILYDLGLFKGTENGYELDTEFTRMQATVMLVRFLGAEDEVLNTQYTSVFDDIKNDSWGLQYVMYCYNENITKGTGEKKFSPDTPVSGEQFVTLMLRAIGFSAEPDNAYDIAVTKGMFTSGYVDTLEKKTTFLRDDMVYIAYRALKTMTPDNISLADKLIQKGVFTAEQAEKAGVLISSTENMNEVLDSLYE